MVGNAEFVGETTDYLSRAEFLEACGGLGQAVECITAWRGITPVGQLAALGILCRTGPGSSGAPGSRRLAALLCRDERHIRRVLQALEATGHMRRAGRREWLWRLWPA